MFKIKVSLNIQTTQTLIPPLVEQTKQLKRTFALIDALEVISNILFEIHFFLKQNKGFIQQVNQSVATLEQNVSSVEQNSSIFSQKAKRVFQSFSDFRKKKLGESSTTSPESESGISSGSTTEGTSENILNNPSATLSSTSLSASAIKFDSNYLLVKLKSDFVQTKF